jgi:transcriptional regulator with XRE-family HTH domain
VNVPTVKRSPHATDRYVGNRVRMRRKMQGMTQQKHGDALGVTFQQVQKYESGTNRIGANRLQHIASIQQVPISFFFEGDPDHHLSSTSPATMSPASSPRRRGLRSRKPTSRSKTPSSGDPLLLWSSRWPETTNLNRSRCGSFDRHCPQVKQDGRVWDCGKRCYNSMSLLGVVAAIIGFIWLMLNVPSIRKAVL